MTSRNGRPTIVPAEWDSAFFGVRIGRLLPNADEHTDLDAVQRLDRSGVDCVWIDVDVGAAHLIDRWTGLGARVVDLRVDMAASLRGGDALAPAAEVEMVTTWSDGDRDAMTRLAVEQASLSRLSRDPAFAKDVPRMYRGWVARAFTGEHQAFVWRDTGRVVGMLTGKYEGDVAWIELLDVDGTHRGRGIGSALVAGFLRDARSRGHSQARVRTQLRNLPAIRTYERAGFATDRISIVLHWWGRAL